MAEEEESLQIDLDQEIDQQINQDNTDCEVSDDLSNFYDINNQIDNVKNFLDNKKTYKMNYENDISTNKELLNTRLGMLNNIQSVNTYNKKVIMMLIAIMFGIIIAITSIVVLNNKRK